jgi:von Willebrand factor type A domain
MRIFFGSLLLFLAATIYANVDQPPASDVRVLIDISGSMKKTDPKNVRKSALDLIVRLLPDKSRAGVWLFGNDVNMIMPHSLVDANWRKQAAQKAEQISSIGLFTNIGKALERVSFDREKLNTEYKTHIILLTDGVVDISKETAINTKAREAILTELLPVLKNAGYVVHTIALSADADADLLKKISVATDGKFITAHSADDLTSTFLKIFDQAVPAERVPLDKNGFLVDASVKEFTALIFRKMESEKTLLVTPDGKELSFTSLKDGINWYRADKYDLVTATAPKAGQWAIKTDITIQSRVTVISDLRLAMQPLKNNMMVNDSLALDYSFQENNKVITNRDFLNLLETSVIIVTEGAEENKTLDLTMPSPPEDGIYHQSISAFKISGDYDIHLYVDGKTFKREFKHSVTVGEPVASLEKPGAVIEKPIAEPAAKMQEPEKAEHPEAKPMKKAAEKIIEKTIEKPVEEASSVWVYVSIAVGNLLIVLLAFFGYRMIKKPLDASGKTEINLSEESPQNIPMSDDPISQEVPMDNLFPLDDMEDSTK